MSNQGPRRLRTKDGYAYAKFNGCKINFGRHVDAFRARWLPNRRELTDDMLPDRAVRRDAITVEQLAAGSWDRHADRSGHLGMLAS